MLPKGLKTGVDFIAQSRTKSRPSILFAEAVPMKVKRGREGGGRGRKKDGLTVQSQGKGGKDEGNYAERLDADNSNGMGE